MRPAKPCGVRLFVRRADDDQLPECIGTCRAKGRRPAGVAAIKLDPGPDQRKQCRRPTAPDRAKERMAWYNTFMTRPSGAHWKEAALGLQQIMGDYAAAGPYRVRSETLLDAGLKYLGDLRRDAEASVRAANAHELLRTVEAFELMDNGEAIMHAARERRESRGMHLRSDYTFTNPLLNDKFLTVRRENGRVVTEWRPRRSA